MSYWSVIQEVPYEGINELEVFSSKEEAIIFVERWIKECRSCSSFVKVDDEVLIWNEIRRNKVCSMVKILPVTVLEKSDDSEWFS